MEDTQQVFFFSGVDLELLEFFFDGLFLLRLALSQFLHVELELPLASPVFLLKNYAVLVLPLQRQRQVSETNGFLLFLLHYNIISFAELSFVHEEYFSLDRHLIRGYGLR